MAETQTHSERRAASLHRDLIPIHEELKKEMAGAFRSAVVDTSPYELEKEDVPAANFRHYDQSQNFFITVSQKAFLDAEHPAAVIDRIVERLDLNEVYAEYSKEVDGLW
jgi:hypothetical protein